MLAAQTILDAKAATGWGTSIRVKDKRHCVLTFATDGLGVGESITIKVAHSYEETCPDFTSAKAVTNRWAYVQVFDLEGGPPINGADGITISGADDVKNLEINQNSATWINVQVTTIDAGTVTVTAILSEQ